MSEEGLSYDEQKKLFHEYTNEAKKLLKEKGVANLSDKLASTAKYDKCKVLLNHYSKGALFGLIIIGNKYDIDEGEHTQIFADNDIPSILEQCGDFIDESSDDSMWKRIYESAPVSGHVNDQIKRIKQDLRNLSDQLTSIRKKLKRVYDEVFIDFEAHMNEVDKIVKERKLLDTIKELKHESIQ